MLATQHPTPIPLHQPSPLRTNADLNLSVLQRHNHHITSIVSIAPYAVIYTFSPSTQTWEKSGIEGSLFVCQLAPDTSPYTNTAIERYSVHVLNRRGLDNFSLELTTPEEIEVTEEYIILQGTTGAIVPFPPAEEGAIRHADEEAEAVIYGVWVFAETEPSSTAMMREINARVILDCAARAEQTRGVAGCGQGGDEVEGDEEDYQEEPQETVYEAKYPGHDYEQMGTNGSHYGYRDGYDERQLEQETQRQKLLNLFGNPAGQSRSPPTQPPQQQYHGGYIQEGRPAQGGQPRQDVLDDLFRRARQGHNMR